MVRELRLANEPNMPGDPAGNEDKCALLRRVLKGGRLSSREDDVRYSIDKLLRNLKVGDGYCNNITMDDNGWHLLLAFIPIPSPQPLRPISPGSPSAPRENHRYPHPQMRPHRPAESVISAWSQSHQVARPMIHKQLTS